jgi:iron complex transport system substrate-binding protein
MRTLPTLKTVGVLLFLVLSLGCNGGHNDQATRHVPKRVISFAPSITETLFALGVGDRVVGVTRYCNYPLQTKSLPRVGGYTDPNFEMILGLKPDLVITLKQHSTLSDFLKKNGIEQRMVDDEDFEAILQSFATIGAIFGKTHEADSIAASIRGQIVVASPCAARPRILLCIGRDNPGSGSVAKVYAAGPKSFYTRLIDLAGGVNAYTDSTFSYPAFSTEGLIRLSPDIIIDLMASVAAMPQNKVSADWKGLTMIPAVKNGLVFCPDGDFMIIPGPRIGLALAEIKKTVALYGKQGIK